MGADKVDNRPYKPDKMQWTWLGIVVVLIALLIIWKLAM